VEEKTISELYQQYNLNPNNEPLSDPVALQMMIDDYSRQIENAIKDSNNRRLSKDQRELSSNRIQHLRKTLKEWQDAYNYVAEELKKLA
jgi:nitrate reductase assembly molybdenum cofactor insertion protein NarJ